MEQHSPRLLVAVEAGGGWRLEVDLAVGLGGAQRGELDLEVGLLALGGAVEELLGVAVELDVVAVAALGGPAQLCGDLVAARAARVDRPLER